MVVAVLPDWQHAQAHSPLRGEGLATAMSERRAVLQSCLAERGGRALAGDEATVVAAFSAPSDAFEAGLDAVRAGASVGLSLGQLHDAGAHCYGAPLSAARRMAAQLQHDLAIDLAASQHVEVPAGVGSFRAPEHREQAAGVQMLVLADYRHQA